MEWTIIVSGFAGGMVRGLVGFIKYQYSYKNVGFNVPYFICMVFLSGVVGTLAAIAFNQNEFFSFIIGYSGGDFIENIYKIIAKTPSLYSLPELMKKK